MIEFLQLQDAAAVERWSAPIAEWVFATGAEYFHMLFGDPEIAKRSLESWIKHPNSEFSGLHATLAMNNGRSIGVFITMPGTEIPKRRLFDTLYLLKNCKSDRRLALRDFLSAFANVLLPVGESDFYLRTLAVGAEHRGRGYGRQLLEQAITAGARAGFKRIRLDVNGNNAPALHLYQDCGFKIIHEATVPAFCHRVCAMLLER